MSIPSLLCLPIAQFFTEFCNPFAHQDCQNSQREQDDAGAADHYDGGDDIQQVVDQNVDHAHDADHQEEDGGECQTARADDHPVDQHSDGLEEQYHKVDQTFRAVAHHLDVGRAQQGQL